MSVHIDRLGQYAAGKKFRITRFVLDHQTNKLTISTFGTVSTVDALEMERIAARYGKGILFVNEDVTTVQTAPPGE
jgi:hypothetical protein